jgi:hypothetical protein
LSSPTHPSYASLNTQGTTGNWIGVNDKYLGMYFIYKGQMYCGWARLDIDAAPTNFTFKDYACKTIPFDGILTGEGIPVGIWTKNQIQNHSIYMANHRLFLELQGEGSYLISILTIEGQVAKTIKADKSTREIILSDLKSGCYLISVEGEKMIYSTKVIID